MKKKPTKKWERVVVVWIDSLSIRLGGKTWHSFTEIENHMAAASIKTDYILTTGYKFHETKDWILLACEMSFEGGMPVMFGGVVAIPKGCIKSIKRA